MFLDPEGWHILEYQPFTKSEMNEKDREKFRMARELYSANNGMSFVN